MPFGTGALAVRDIAALHAAHDGTSSYLKDMQAAVASRTPVTSGPSLPLLPVPGRHRSRPELDVEKFPELLRPVLGSNYQLRRLQTFLQIAGYRSLADACAALALCPFSVYKQLHRLEQDLGGPVLLRALKNRPMEPTELGHRVLAAALPLAELLGLPAGSVQVAPPSPGQTRKRRPRTTTAPWLKQFPALLRPALGTKRRPATAAAVPRGRSLPVISGFRPRHRPCSFHSDSADLPMGTRPRRRTPGTR